MKRSFTKFLFNLCQVLQKCKWKNVPLGTVESNFSFIAWRNTSFYLLIELIWEQLIVATFCLLFYAQIFNGKSCKRNDVFTHINECF